MLLAAIAHVIASASSTTIYVTRPEAQSATLDLKRKLRLLARMRTLVVERASRSQAITGFWRTWRMTGSVFNALEVYIVIAR